MGYQPADIYAIIQSSVAARIWERGFLAAKAIEKLGSIQRRPLLAMTETYRTVSTDALQALAGVEPMGIELKEAAVKQKVKTGA